MGVRGKGPGGPAGPFPRMNCALAQTNLVAAERSEAALVNRDPKEPL
jgi:hypothetical protein